MDRREMVTVQNQFPLSPNLTQGPWRITFDTNPDDCNLACIMCEEHSSYARHQKLQARRTGKRVPPRRMNDKLIEKVITGVAGAGLREIIPSTMGEPLLYPDFEKIIALCKQFGISLNLTTNGTFPGRSVTEWGQLILPVARDVKISWNGSTPALNDAIMEKGSTLDRLEKIKIFLALRDRVMQETGHHARVTFQLTFMDRNLADIPAIIKLAASLGIDRVKGHHLWVHHDGMKQESLRRDEGSITRWNTLITRLPEYLKEFRRPDGSAILLENFFPLSLDSTQIGLDFTCPFLNQEAWVAPDGTFNPCCAPDILRRQLGSFGNLNDTPLLDIWSGEQYRNLCRDYLRHPLCQTCNMRRPTCAAQGELPA